MIKADGLYIHFPYCKHLCNYCDFYKVEYDENGIDQFEKQLLLQFEQIKNIDFSSLNSLYLGGGTPSLWGVRGSEYLRQLFLKNNIKFNDDIEITLEVDPDSWSENEIEEWISFGVNRFSLGVQAFDDFSLSTLDRQHSVGDVEKTLKYFSERGLNYSVDFLLGAPIVNRNIIQELEKALQYNPLHFSVYILKTRANYPLKDQEPDDDLTADEYMDVCDYLKSNGYVHYEVSNFAKLGYESRHNKAYWDLKNILAIGPNATGFYVENNKAIRYQVAAQSNKLVLEELSEEAYKLEKFYLGLRTNNGVNPSLFITQDDWSKMQNVLLQWQENEMFEVCRFDKLILNSEGFVVLDSLIDEFFKYTSL